MALDDTNLEIIIEPSSNLSHGQTPVAGDSSVPQDESRRLNEMTPEDLDFLKKQVCEYARKDKWKEAESIFNKYAYMVRIRLTAGGDTALHVAVRANSITFVKGLVNLMTPLDLQIHNRWGYTAFLMAQRSRNSDLVQIMIEKKQDLDSLKKQVWEYAREDNWKDAESIFNKYADMVRIPLTDERNTVLHVAADANSITFVKGLLNLMTPQALQIRNIWGYTAFYMAAGSGNSDLVQIMIEKNQNLPLIRSTYERRLPVHWAAISAKHKIVQDLSSETLLQNMYLEDIEELFLLTIEHDMYDVATKLFEEYPRLMAGAEEQGYRTALEILLRKRPEGLMAMSMRPSSGNSLQLLQKIWLQFSRRSEWLDSSWLVSAMADALESRNVEAAKWLLSRNPELLHYAVLQRHSSIPYIFEKVPPDLLQTVDKDDNNILHLAAYHLKKEENSSSLTATNKMTREIAWFKEVAEKVPPEIRTRTNREGMTPKDVFQDKHKDLSREVKDTAKGIADSGMLVAALVATIAFAAALVVPGDKTNPGFIVFILANAAALFTSSASILTFLSNFTTSRFADSEFIIALHPSLILGPMLLLISIVAMTISFAAASFLIFEHTSKWVAYVVTSMGVVPILLFLLFQIRIFDTFLWSRFYRMSEVE